MLPIANKNDMVNKYRETIDLLGTPFTHHHEDGTTGGTLTAHFVPQRADDAHLIAAIGMEARIVNMKETPKVEKYDYIVSPSGMEYTIHTVHEVYVNDVLVGQRLFVKS